MNINVHHWTKVMMNDEFTNLHWQTLISLQGTF